VGAHDEINPTLPRIALGAKSDASGDFLSGKRYVCIGCLGVGRIKRFLVLGVGLIVGALRVEVGVANGRPVILRLGESI
jgi:hypothetical protein